MASKIVLKWHLVKLAPLKCSGGPSLKCVFLCLFQICTTITVCVCVHCTEWMLKAIKTSSVISVVALFMSVALFM